MSENDFKLIDPLDLIDVSRVKKHKDEYTFCHVESK